MTAQPPEVPLHIRLIFGHAAVQQVADSVGADILHIKGYALDRKLAFEGRASTDVDIVVRPSHVDLLSTQLLASGWTVQTGFEAGSAFGHALTLTHPQWGYLDLHRHIPGLGVDAASAFDELWQGRREATFAGQAAWAPSIVSQRLVLMLHAPRSGVPSRSAEDLNTVWEGASPVEREETVRLARHLQADVAFGAAVGDMDGFRDRREFRLWRAVSQSGTRTEEWLGRILAANGTAARLKLILRVPLVNVEHLAVLLGRQPTRDEIVQEFFSRGRRGAGEIAGVVARWWRERQARS